MKPFSESKIQQVSIQSCLRTVHSWLQGIHNAMGQVTSTEPVKIVMS